jgi:hypothetical protein
METGASVDGRTGKRSVIGSILGAILLAGLVSVALDLLAMAFAAPDSATASVARGGEGVVAIERQLPRGGAMLGYPIQF